MGDDPVSKSFLAVGDHLINPDLLAYAVMENDETEPLLRLGFAVHSVGEGRELVLHGEEAKELLRWLRRNADFLTREGRFGSVGGVKPSSIEGESQSVPRQSHSSIGQEGTRSAFHGPRQAPLLRPRFADRTHSG
jgi:hypothetical protein